MKKPGKVIVTAKIQMLIKLQQKRVKLLKNFNENIEIKNNMKQKIMEPSEELQQQKQYNFDIEEIKDDDDETQSPNNCKPQRKRFLSTEESTLKQQDSFASDEVNNKDICESNKLKGQFSSEQRPSNIVECIEGTVL
eukprot:TRINITY_DN10781_c0_g1_i1.p2 TRINITY_DN10781_c0_g1~~TRINITY_DN10781_c0_g1_i1.p2  ORF type:complete len:137 (-),score=34.06 TRINITY_DN10781_c0_g1_i1:54-464(-)